MKPLNVTVIGTTLGYQPTVINWKTNGSRRAGSSGLKDEYNLETSLPRPSIARPSLGVSGRTTMACPTSVGASMGGLPFIEGCTSRRITTEDSIPDGVSLLSGQPLMQGGRS